MREKVVWAQGGLSTTVWVQVFDLHWRRRSRVSLNDRHRSLPDPGVSLSRGSQPGPHGILTDILDFLSQTLIRSEYVVKALRLPNRPAASEVLVHSVCRVSFDRMHNLGHAKGTFVIGKEREDEMNMIGHNDGTMQEDQLTVLARTRIQDDLPQTCWNIPTPACSEGHEYGPIVFLNVRQFSPVHIRSRAGINVTGHFAKRVSSLPGRSATTLVAVPG